MTDRFLALTVPFRHSSWGTFIQLLLLTLVPGSLCAANPTITVQVSSETAPPGGTAQFKIALSAPAPKPPESAALEALRALDPNALSPREALDLLFRLQTLVADEARARALCDVLKKQSQACVPVLPH